MSDDGMTFIPGDLATLSKRQLAQMTRHSGETVGAAFGELMLFIVAAEGLIVEHPDDAALAGDLRGLLAALHSGLDHIRERSNAELQRIVTGKGPTRAAGAGTAH